MVLVAMGGAGIVQDNTQHPLISQRPSKTMTADSSGRFPRASVREQRGAGASGFTIAYINIAYLVIYLVVLYVYIIYASLV